MSQRYDIFSQLFGDSMVTPIKQHMAVCNDTAQTLAPFFDAVLIDDLSRTRSIFKEICDREHDADERKRSIRLHLPSGMLLSVSRNDLLEWVRAQDKIANVSRDLAGVVSGRAVHIPAFLHDDLRRSLDQALATVDALNEVLSHLDTLVGTGFIPGRAHAIENGVDKVDDAERASDKLEQAARQRLFEHEEELDPVDVMFLYQIIDLIGEVAGRSQAVANRIRIALAN